jgi:pimeloyl-ACP methyl ester carboxylesterase
MTRRVTSPMVTCWPRQACSAEVLPEQSLLRRLRAKNDRMRDQRIRLADGRVVGFADYGLPAATAVLWCHGGPGSRIEPAHLAAEATRAGLRIIGIDRPGYGLSTPEPGRTITGWVPEALAVADHLGIGQFATAGTSTGGAYALALAALAPDRVLGVVACCAMTDMRWPEGRATMSRPHTHAVWEAPDRAAAIAAAIDAHGEGGSKMRGAGMAAALAATDVEFFSSPAWMTEAAAAFGAMFAQGLEGYADDRLADGGGWVSFDAASIRCPVTVLHGASDRIVDVIHAGHTVELIPGADLVIFEELGHFSITTQVVPAIRALLQR